MQQKDSSYALLKAFWIILVHTRLLIAVDTDKQEDCHVCLTGRNSLDCQSSKIVLLCALILVHLCCHGFVVLIQWAPNSSLQARSSWLSGWPATRAQKSRCKSCCIDRPQKQLAAMNVGDDTQQINKSIHTKDTFPSVQCRLYFGACCLNICGHQICQLLIHIW